MKRILGRTAEPDYWKEVWAAAVRWKERTELDREGGMAHLERVEKPALKEQLKRRWRIGASREGMLQMAQHGENPCIRAALGRRRAKSVKDGS